MREPLRDPGRLEHILTCIDNVQDFVAWKTATKDLPALRPQIAAILEEMNKNNIQ